jgi:hypothetical protein
MNGQYLKDSDLSGSGTLGRLWIPVGERFCVFLSKSCWDLSKIKWIYEKSFFILFLSGFSFSFTFHIVKRRRNSAM